MDQELDGARARHHLGGDLGGAAGDDGDTPHVWIKIIGGDSNEVGASREVTHDRRVPRQLVVHVDLGARDRARDAHDARGRGERRVLGASLGGQHRDEEDRRLRQRQAGGEEKC